MKHSLLPYMVLLVSLTTSVGIAAAPLENESYTKDVVPIIHDYCLSCHQPGGQGFEKSGLDMRTYESLMKGTKFGSVVKPGDSFTSIFIQVIEGRVHASIKMPYGMNGGLAKEKIKVLKNWVEQGAKNN